MKNKIVMLIDGKTKCRILDTIIYKGDTKYLVIEYKTKNILTIFPHHIYDIADIITDNEDLHSIKDSILRIGI